MNNRALLERVQERRRDEAAIRAYSVDGFCAAFGVSRSVAYQELAAGRLRSYNVGRRRFISVEAAAAWQADREAEAA